MSTLLFGNGINIEFGGNENTNKSIILRAIKSVSRADYPKHIFIDEPQLIIEFFGFLFPELASFLNHQYDRYAITNDEKNSLSDFIRRYKSRKSITIADIGFEDYFLMYDLFSRKQNIINPDRYHIREILKCFFLYSIYNDGRVNKIYHYYPGVLQNFLMGFDMLFTTNYDQNIELFTGRKVYYLMGALL